ncbi:19998_t:CDS:2 [Cetraspora pellucida]|uniref:19998_t:CDS:1 n=1 Tax=Cetraspora pellucida TaxID=1433469 RepID=A0A9N9NX05_9GLOM|nr:19998_t:CDS:2 [Cetraspora pellucida]
MIKTKSIKIEQEKNKCLECEIENRILKKYNKKLEKINKELEKEIKEIRKEIEENNRKFDDIKNQNNLILKLLTKK